MKKMRGLKVALPAMMLVALMLSGCSIAVHTGGTRATMGDDLYQSHERELTRVQRKREQNNSNQYAESNPTKKVLKQSNQELLVSEIDYDDGRILVEDRQTAYARRLDAFNSPTYTMPDVYYTMRYSGDYYTLLNYDPNYYTIVVVGNRVWVEPRHIASLYGNWGTSVNISFARSPWFNYYGWNNYYYGWGNWGGWNSWGWGWYPYYYGHHHHGHPSWGGSHWGSNWGHGNYRPSPVYRPGYGSNPGVGGGTLRPGTGTLRPGTGGVSTRPTQPGSGSGIAPSDVGRPTGTTRPGGVITTPGLTGGSNVVTTRPVGETGEGVGVGSTRPTQPGSGSGIAPSDVGRPTGTTRPGSVVIDKTGGTSLDGGGVTINPRPINLTEPKTSDVGRPTGSSGGTVKWSTGHSVPTTTTRPTTTNTTKPTRPQSSWRSSGSSGGSSGGGGGSGGGSGGSSGGSSGGGGGRPSGGGGR